MGKKIEEQYLIVDGIRTHLRSGGDGDPLVLLHGLGGPLMWQRVIEPLSELFHVVVIDLPGFGESDCPSKNFSTENYADFLSHVLERIEIQPVNISGISYGGQIAATFAARHPKKVKKLILIASSGLAWGKFVFGNKTVWTIFTVIVKNSVLRSVALICFLGRFSFYNIASRPLDLCKKYFRQVSSVGKREALLQSIYNIYTGRDEFRACLKVLQIPTLILWGKNDYTVPVKFAYQFQNSIPNSSMTIFSECAHSAPLEKPDEVCSAIRSFLLPSQHMKDAV